MNARSLPTDRLNEAVAPNELDDSTTAEPSSLSSWVYVPPNSNPPLISRPTEYDSPSTSSLEENVKSIVWPPPLNVRRTPPVSPLVIPDGPSAPVMDANKREVSCHGIFAPFSPISSREGKELPP